MYSFAFRWNVLKISMRSISSNMSFKTCVSLLILCFDDLSIDVSGVMPSNTLLIFGTAVGAAQILIWSYFCVFLPPLSTAIRTSAFSFWGPLNVLLYSIDAASA